MESVKTYSRLQKPVLVLNASYEPINICAARRALVLVARIAHVGRIDGRGRIGRRRHTAGKRGSHNSRLRARQHAAS